MKKIKFLFIVLAFVIVSSNIATTIIAVENEEEKTQVEKSKTLTEEEINEQKQEILTSINGYLDDIQHKIKVIDEEIENTKEQEEFEYYPAIRLNIDTPMFGMSAIVENKLRVKKDVSTTDIANKYSIRDIVKERKIRLPDSYLAGIVVATRELKIDENMSISELKLTLVKCIQYESQVNSVEDFVESQINKTFKDYINQEKKNNIKDVKDRSIKVKRSIEEISDKIYELNFMGVDITNYISQYNSVSKELYNITQKSKDTLMNKSELTQLMKDSVTNESNVLNLKTDVEEAYEKAILEMDYLKVLNNFKATYSGKYKRINSYIEDSTTEKEEKVDSEENNNENSSPKITIIKNYSVTSENTDEYFEKIIEDLETKIKDQEEKDKEKNTEEKDKSGTDKEAEKQNKYNENKSKIDELYNKYKEALNRENKFYTNNINMLLNDSNTKMTSIIGQIDSDIVIDSEIFNYTKYIYIDLPDNLSNYLEQNNSSAIIELNNLNNSLYQELKNLVQTNMKIKKMYDKMTEDLLKS